jgi:hypothetical protein
MVPMSDDLTIPLRRRTRPLGDPGRPLGASAALGGAVSAALTLVICMSLALTGWFLADAGAHGETTDAIRVGADSWLIGHGSHFILNGMPIGITPLALTMMLILGAFRSGRWSATRAVAPYDDRSLGLAVAAFAGTYVVVTVVVNVLASRTGAEAGLGRSVLGALLISGLAGGAGIAVGSGRFYDWLEGVPAWAKQIGAGAISGALLLCAAGAVLVAISLLFSFNEAANVSTGDAITLLFVTVLFAPNAALLGSAYLLGPGFAVGTVANGVATSVSPAAPVVLGAVPAVPLLAALPDQGPTPGWLILICVVPVICAAVGVFSAGRSGEPISWDLAALHGAGAGFGSALLVTLAIGLSGGPMGVDRLAHIGAPMGETFIYAMASMVIGGVIGGVAGSWFRARR